MKDIITTRFDKRFGPPTSLYVTNNRSNLPAGLHEVVHLPEWRVYETVGTDQVVDGDRLLTGPILLRAYSEDYLGKPDPAMEGAGIEMQEGEVMFFTHGQIASHEDMLDDSLMSGCA